MSLFTSACGNGISHHERPVSLLTCSHREAEPLPTKLGRGLEPQSRFVQVSLVHGGDDSLAVPSPPEFDESSTDVTPLHGCSIDSSDDGEATCVKEICLDIDESHGVDEGETVQKEASKHPTVKWVKWATALHDEFDIQTGFSTTSTTTSPNEGPGRPRGESWNSNAESWNSNDSSVRTNELDVDLEMQKLDDLVRATNSNPSLGISRRLSSVSCQPMDVQAQVTEFREERAAEKRRIYWSVFLRSSGMMAMGVMFLVAAVIVNMLSDSKSSVVVIILASTGCWIQMLAILGGSTVPFDDDLDIDSMLTARPRVRAMVCFVWGVLSITLSLLPPYLSILGVVPSIGLFFSFRRNDQRLRCPIPTTWIALAILLFMFSSAGGQFYCFVTCTVGICSKHCRDTSGDPSPIFFLARACWYMAALLFLAAAYARQRYSFNLSGGKLGANPSLAFWQLTIFFLAQLGIGVVIGGVSFLAVGRTVEGIGYISTGLPLPMPLVVVMIFGRSRLFSIVVQMFETKQAHKDSAFIAMLLDDATVTLGQDWWMKCDEKDGKCKAWQDWKVGRIVQITEEEFTVRVYPSVLQSKLSKQPTNIEQTWTLQPSAAFNLLSSLSSKSTKSSRFSHFRPVGSIPGVSQLPGIFRHGAFPAVPVDYVFPLAGRGVSSLELLDIAKRNLRCVDWLNMSLELLSSPVGGDHSLSRPLRAGERIDFFLSHSWHDCAKAKWIRLMLIADRFLQDHGRYPTFWLDKVCIDQANIADGLRVLPINVAACKQILALVGETYPYRLWCVWELFTLLAFAEEDQARSRVQLTPLGDADDNDAVETLLEFDVNNAHCYDPNEESRLRRIIDTVGSHQFECCIHRLTAACIQTGMVKTKTTKSTSANRIMG